MNGLHTLASAYRLNRTRHLAVLSCATLERYRACVISYNALKQHTARILLASEKRAAVYHKKNCAAYREGLRAARALCGLKA